MKCHPGNIAINENSAEVPLQNLLDHTALRIIEDQKEVITNVVEGLDDDEQMLCKLVCKYGFDGSSGQSEYKQQFSSPEKTEERLFLRNCGFSTAKNGVIKSSGRIQCRLQQGSVDLSASILPKKQQS